MKTVNKLLDVIFIIVVTAFLIIYVYFTRNDVFHFNYPYRLSYGEVFFQIVIILTILAAIYLLIIKAKFLFNSKYTFQLRIDSVFIKLITMVFLCLFLTYIFSIDFLRVLIDGSNKMHISIIWFHISIRIIGFYFFIKSPVRRL
ncbi:hypothetical protein SAMN06298216_2130 [Spirosomataceae bacterium TFI 002]|nr:hypothetical protein SAMN06298216_2130 [Spirosomataceae bacterium TFI 002]